MSNVSPTLFLFIGQSATGKTTYINNRLIKEGLVHWVRSYTTRPLRADEIAGLPYTVRKKTFFRRDVKKFAVRIFANKETYKTDGAEWHYAVTKAEIDKHAKNGEHLVYDVIQPCYARQLIDYVTQIYPQYRIKVVWFVPPEKGKDVVGARENMPNGTVTRKKNTCTEQDIKDAGIKVDYKLCPREEDFDPEMEKYIATLYNDMMRTKAEIYGFTFYQNAT